MFKRAVPELSLNPHSSRNLPLGNSRGGLRVERGDVASIPQPVFALCDRGRGGRCRTGV